MNDIKILVKELNIKAMVLDTYIYRTKILYSNKQDRCIDAIIILHANLVNLYNFLDSLEVEVIIDKLRKIGIKKFEANFVNYKCNNQDYLLHLIEQNPNKIKAKILFIINNIDYFLITATIPND